MKKTIGFVFAFIVGTTVFWGCKTSKLFTGKVTYNVAAITTMASRSYGSLTAEGSKNTLKILSNRTVVAVVEQRGGGRPPGPLPPGPSPCGPAICLPITLILENGQYYITVADKIGKIEMKVVKGESALLQLIKSSPNQQLKLVDPKMSQ